MSANKKAALLILIVSLLCITLLFLIPKQQGALAQISIDGKTAVTVDLKNSEDKIINLLPYGENIEIEIKDHKIRFLSSDCPNHTCINTGFIQNEGQTAVCLPNKTAITIIKFDK